MKTYALKVFYFESVVAARAHTNVYSDGPSDLSLAHQIRETDG